MIKLSVFILSTFIGLATIITAPIVFVIFYVYKIYRLYLLKRILKKLNEN